MYFTWILLLIEKYGRASRTNAPIIYYAKNSTDSKLNIDYQTVGVTRYASGCRSRSFPVILHVNSPYERLQSCLFATFVSCLPAPGKSVFMKKMTGVILVALIACLWSCVGSAQSVNPSFRVLALYENGGHHLAYSKAARPWLDKLAADSNFAIEYINNTNLIDDDYLARFQVFLQLDYPPYTWPDKAVKAFERYIEMGKGGWVGFHHATLLGEFDGYPIWPWFSNFMGGIRFDNYIPGFASGRVNVEDTVHPVMKGVPRSFEIEKEEWYTWNKNPRLQVKVLASVDEHTYQPDSKIKMGDHPVVWSNPAYPARNIYIFMGHAPELFNNTAYTTLFRNALFWTAGK